LTAVIEPLWVRARFRDDEVLARCDGAGAFVVVDGMVPFQYQAGGKIYRTRADRLAVSDGASPAPAPAPAEPAAPARPRARPRATGGAPQIGREPRPETEAVQLWTDGACTGNPGPAGAGVLYRHRGEVREVSEYLGHGTNNIAELTAILRGLQLVEDGSTPVDVMTDSAYCHGLLTKAWKAKKNQELVAELRAEARRFADLRIVKVPGHSGVPDNERADELATGAIVR
jgi:ribonuclease HI